MTSDSDRPAHCDFRCKKALTFLRSIEGVDYHKCDSCGHRIITGRYFWSSRGFTPFDFEEKGEFDFGFSIDDGYDFGF